MVKRGAAQGTFNTFCGRYLKLNLLVRALNHWALDGYCASVHMEEKGFVCRVP